MVRKIWNFGRYSKIFPWHKQNSIILSDNDKTLKYEKKVATKKLKLKPITFYDTLNSFENWTLCKTRVYYKEGL